MNRERGERRRRGGDDSLWKRDRIESNKKTMHSTKNEEKRNRSGQDYNTAQQSLDFTS